ncbi:MAG: type II toxin-antitoxin system prevent-host-death family antitoxin [Verrucomicrobiota bacterium JB022]|nr:type II toxin-antitoxin system prevent-host-death family antitoxin [Verrucomicrobiota bacterium JB022]
MQIASIQEAGNQLPHLLAKVAAGEEVVLSHHGTLVARIVPFEAPKGGVKLGLMAHLNLSEPATWDNDEETQAAFEDPDIFPST